MDLEAHNEVSQKQHLEYTHKKLVDTELKMKAMKQEFEALSVVTLEIPKFDRKKRYLHKFTLHEVGW